MSTTFLFGYIAFMVVTIIGVNLIARRSRPARLAGDADAPALSMRCNSTIRTALRCLHRK